MRGRWKSVFSDSVLQLAVVLSILRIDIRVYLRQYTEYPEVQQALMGSSVGLQLVDNYHSNDILPHRASKYIDEREQMFHELHRLTETAGQLQLQTNISTWLVTSNSTVSLPPPAADHTTNPGISQVELSQQDAALIEWLWKEDLNTAGLMGRTASFDMDSKQQRDSSEGSVTQRVAMPATIPSPSTSVDSAAAELLPWSSTGDPGSEIERPPYNTQSSLEAALQDLAPFDDPMGATATNSSVLYPDLYPVQPVQTLDRDTAVNDSGVLWASSESYQLPQQDPPMSLDDFTVDDMDLPFPDLDDMDILPDMGIDFDLDPAEMLESLDDELEPDTVSVDSAMGSSPTHSWSDGASFSGSERHSISSTDSLDLDDGAVGYTKTEPYDKKYYDASRRHLLHNNESAVSHNHTYGAPPGGVPHVRKMDIKVPKVPSRGLVHDEAMCSKFKIPFGVEKIINTPVDEFNSLLQMHHLTAKQITLVKDIRRRGKNKVAAQNCRLKRVGEHSELAVEVDCLKDKRDAIYQKHAVLLQKTTQVRKHIDIMSAEIFHTLRDENGMPYDTSRFSLEVGGDGEIHVTSTETSQRSRGGRKRDQSKRRRR